MPPVEAMCEIPDPILLSFDPNITYPSSGFCLGIFYPGSLSNLKKHAAGQLLRTQIVHLLWIPPPCSIAGTDPLAGRHMGRGRGKGKKLTAVSSHDDPGSGAEDSIPAYRRRGRPQKGVKDELDEEEVEKIEEEEEIKPMNMTKDNKIQTGTENGKKRKRHAQITDGLDLGAEKNGVGNRSSMDEPTKPNAFRRNGSRRKSKPRRAAEAGVECK
eukprot:Gb_09559 [translate_table: standard]